jgi:hypothetical protein
MLTLLPRRQRKDSNKRASTEGGAVQFIDRMDQNQSITARFLDDKEFRGAVSRYLLKSVYEQIRGEALGV